MQEAYRQAHIKYSVCCPGLGVPHPWWGCSIPEQRRGVPIPGQGYPIPRWGYPIHGGDTPSLDGVPHLWLGYPHPDLARVPASRRDLGPVTWVPLLGVDRHTPVKTVPSRRTTYAGGNNITRKTSH